MFHLGHHRLKLFQVLLLLTFWCCCLGIVNAQRPGLPNNQPPKAPPFQWARSHNFDVQHYKIALSFDWEKRAVNGETTIILRPFEQNFKEMELDAGNMTINSVRLEKGGQLQFRYPDKEHLYITLDRNYAPTDELAITINYSAIPNRRGLTIFTPTAQEPQRRYQIWSQGETTTNHYWFPCYDYPNDKATSEMIVTVEDKYTVISNGRLVEVRNSGKNMKTWHWSIDKPFSSYLVSLIVGEYTELKDKPFKGKPVSSYVYPDQAENGRVSLSRIGDMVAYLSERIGYDYPYDKYAQTGVQDFGGAMENISATTMNDMIIHDARAHLDNSADPVTCHELAHQWFGDLLTCNNWGEIWLNESFATFMEGVWSEHDKGADEARYEYYEGQQQYFAVWNRGIRRPIVTTRYNNNDSVFDAYAYPRGSAVLNMLRFTLGEEAFWRGINHYVKENQFRNVTTPDLIKAIEDATGQNMSWFFDQWIYKIGHPVFEITSKYDEASKKLTLSVKQTQKPDEQRPWFQSAELFMTPVDVAVTTPSGEKVFRKFIKQREEEFTFDLDAKPLIINFDRGSYIISEVKFDRSAEDLAYQLLHDTDVMGRVRAAVLLKDKPGDVATRALAEALRSDRFWAVRRISAESLGTFKTDAAREALLVGLRDQDSRIRRAAINQLGELKDTKLADTFINVINSDQSYFAVAGAARALGMTGAPNANEVLLRLLEQDSWGDIIRGGAIDGLASLKEKNALPLLLKYAQPGNTAGTRTSALVTVAQLGKGQEEVFNTLMQALDAEAPRVVISAIQGLVITGDMRAIPRLEALKQKADLANFFQAVILQAIEQIKAANAPKTDSSTEQK